MSHTITTLADDRLRAGFVLPAIVVVIAVLGAVVLASWATAGDELKASWGMRESAKALYAADAGIQHVLAAWTQQRYDTLMPNPGDTVALSWQTVPENGTRFAARLRRIDNGGTTYFSVTVVGRGAGVSPAQRSIKALVTEASQSRFRAALLGEGLVRIGGGFADSYDSRLGPYGAGNRDSHGDVTSNTGDIELSGGATIQGDATAGGTVNDPAQVTGTVTMGATPAPAMPIIPCPDYGYTPSVPPGPGVSYDPVTGELVVGGGNNLTLSTPPTPYYFSEVKATGGSTLTFNAAGGHIDVYISDKLVVGGGGIANPGARPTAVTIWSCDDPSKPADWVLSGGSGAYFALYAPNHKVKIGGSGDLWGSVVAMIIDVSGGSRMHFDKALVTGGGGGGGEFTIVTGSWTELAR